MTRPARLVTVLLVAGLVMASCARDDRFEVTVRVTEDVSASTTAAPPSSTTTTAAPTTTTTAPTTTTTEPPRPTVVLGFAGDTSFTNGLDARDPFGDLDGLLAEPDLMFVNLETAVADVGVGTPFPKSFVFRSPPESLGLLVDAGVDVVLLGNNHVLDYGPSAVDQTLTEIDEAGLARVGAGRTAEEAVVPLVVEVEGWRIGVVSASRVPCDWSASGENTRPEVNWACPTLVGPVEASISELTATTDLVIVTTHGGPEGELCAGSMMLELSARWAELGADVIVNGHPHVLQGIRSVGDALLVESTGNFAFPSARGLTANSAMFRFELAETERGGDPEVSLQVVPVLVPGGVASLPGPDRAAQILEQIEGHSTGWVLDDEGRAIPSPDHTGRC